MGEPTLRADRGCLCCRGRGFSRAALLAHPRGEATRRELRLVARAESYRRGRSALRALLARLGENPEKSFAFPHSRFSITHSGAVAIAFGVRAGQTRAGAGIDYETSARVSSKAERFFLRSEER